MSIHSVTFHSVLKSQTLYPIEDLIFLTSALSISKKA